MTNKKMTKKEMFAIVRGIVMESENCTDEVLAFIDHEVDLLERKKSSSAKTKSQVANEKIMDLIVQELSLHDKAMTVTELMQTSALAGLSNQKLSALLRLLKEEGRVVKTIDKKKSYFSLAE